MKGKFEILGTGESTKIGIKDDPDFYQFYDRDKNRNILNMRRVHDRLFELTLCCALTPFHAMQRKVNHAISLTINSAFCAVSKLTVHKMKNVSNSNGLRIHYLKSQT